jgi:hypothetical protein
MQHEPGKHGDKETTMTLDGGWIVSRFHGTMTDNVYHRLICPCGYLFYEGTLTDLYEGPQKTNQSYCISCLKEIPGEIIGFMALCRTNFGTGG